MTTGVTCTVYVDGVRAADGSPGDNLADPVILDDLAVTWGRDDTMSQPEPDTCTFTVMDQSGGRGFGAMFRTGLRVDVIARGDTYPEPSLETFVNPGFEDDVVTWAPVGATAIRSDRRASTGDYSLAVKPTVAGARGGVLLAPAELQAPGTNPDAWDLIPVTSVGQRWAWSLSLWVPEGATATIGVVRFSGPYADAAVPVGAVETLHGDGSWQTMTGDRVVQLDDQWIGLAVTLDPTGPTWDELPPSLTWDGVDPSLTWDDYGQAFLDDVTVTAPEGSSARGVLVFSGRITDLAAQWDPATNAPGISVAAAGFTADLDNRLVGDAPWNVETLDVRAHRILDAAGLPVSIDVDTSVDSILMSWRDVDRQGATGLLRELATSVDGVLWPAVHQSLGAYLRLEDPSLRPSLLKLFKATPTAPIELRRNLFTNPDAVGLTGAVPTNFGVSGSLQTVTQVDSTAPGGRKAARFTRTATGGSRVTVGPIVLTPGLVYTVRMTVASQVPRSATLNYRPQMGVSTGNVLIVSPPTFGAGAPTDIVGTFTAPAGITATGGFVWVVSAGVAGEWLDITKVTVEHAPTSPSAFSGATPDTPTRVYDWTGTPDASMSTESTVAIPTYIEIVETDPASGFDLSACQVLRDPVTWVQTVSDVVTRVAVSWKVQGVDDDGNPTTSDSTVTEVNASLESRYGTRGASVSTQLQAAEDATDVAQRILARTSPNDWRAQGVTVEDDDVPAGADGVALMLDLLDGTSRIGAPIVLGELPSWTPSGASVGVYLEGGTYRYIGGRWVLELLVSSAVGLGQSAAWDDLDPAWTWDQWSPELTWNDLRGVAAPS